MLNRKKEDQKIVEIQVDRDTWHLNKPALKKFLSDMRFDQVIEVAESLFGKEQFHSVVIEAILLQPKNLINPALKEVGLDGIILIED